MHEYEQQGVTATQDMQRAARKVAQDNVRLRSLLALHGVQQEEVESYLRSPEEAIIAEAHLPSLLWSMANHQRGTSETNSSLFLNSAGPWGRTQTRHFDVEYMHVDSDSAPHRQPTRTTQGSEKEQEVTQNLDPTGTPTATADENIDLEGPSESDDITYTCSETNSVGCQDALGCFCPPVPENDQYLSSPGLEISCETAATIIAEMRGDGDKDSVRASLGCRGREGCNIKNTTVLQVMEESWG